MAIQSNETLPVCPQCKATMKESAYYLNQSQFKHCEDRGLLNGFGHQFEFGEHLYSWWCGTQECQRQRAAILRQGMEPILEKIIKEKPETILPKFGIPERYFAFTLDSISGLGKIVRELRKYAIEKEKGNLFFTGNSRTGKTHLAIGVMIEMIKQGKINLWFQDVSKLMLKLREAAGRDCEEGMREYEIIHNLESCDFLVLDDLGAEKSSEYAIQALQLIINGRLANRKPTIVTSNLLLNSIHEEMPRIAARLAEYEVKSFLNVKAYKKNETLREREL